MRVERLEVILIILVVIMTGCFFYSNVRLTDSILETESRLIKEFEEFKKGIDDYSPTEIHNNYHFRLNESDQMIVKFYVPENERGALGTKIRTGVSAAVSRYCEYLLGRKVYIRGYGVRTLEDVLGKDVDEESGLCIIDIAVPSHEMAIELGKIKTNVTVLPEGF